MALYLILGIQKRGLALTPIVTASKKQEALRAYDEADKAYFRDSLQMTRAESLQALRHLNELATLASEALKGSLGRFVEAGAIYDL